MATILIGTGHLTWEMVERQSGRYGTVELTPPTELGDGGAASQGEGEDVFVALTSNISGYGRLSARIISPRESQHVGDRIRGFAPSFPNADELIVLGEGEAHYDTGYNGCMCFGVKPLNGRRNFWMSPENMFRCHSSVVELLWESLEAPTNVVPFEEEECDGFTFMTFPGEGFMQMTTSSR